VGMIIKLESCESSVVVDSLIVIMNRYYVISCIIDQDTYEINLGNSDSYPKIINLRTGRVPQNQKGVLRKVLYNMGYDVPTHNNFTTHDSIRLMYKLLNKKPLNQREKNQRLYKNLPSSMEINSIRVPHGGQLKNTRRYFWKSDFTF